MNLALALALIATTLNLSTAIFLFTLAHAPGWKAARVFSGLALTAGLYSAGNVVFALAGLPDAVYLAAGRGAYALGLLHVVLWLLHAYGGPDASPRAMPRPIQALALFGTALAVILTVTGVHLTPVVTEVVIPWPRAVYHYPVANPLGEAVLALAPLLLAVSYVKVFRTALRGEWFARMVILGFTVFFACTVVEVLVAARVFAFPSLMDLGFLAIVMPASTEMLRRLMRDARRLEALTGRLAGEVRERTEERDRAEAALVEAEHHAALGRLAAGVGHEINNPLTYLLLALEEVGAHLRESAAPAPVREALVSARDGAQRIQKVVEGLRTYSRRQAERRPLEPAALVNAALRVAGPHLRHLAGVRTELETTGAVRGDEARLVQALVNLLVNASQAIAQRPGAGHIVVRARSRDAREVVLEVEDDGPGLAREALAHLAEPYFTTRGESGGLGLGLFVTRGIVDSHGGRLEFDSEPGRGMRARIVLPLDPESAVPDDARAPRDEPPPPPAPASSSRRLLLVDDEPAVLELLGRQLEREWVTTCALDGAAALAALQRERFDAVVCDLMMPGLTGMELAERLARLDPALRRRTLFLTGGAVTAEAQAFLDRPDVCHLMKPIRASELSERLAALLRETGV
jgi:signal transduction histidine kinase/CheY-like chemotaxis protein